jgi:hypothetical protein
LTFWPFWRTSEDERPVVGQVLDRALDLRAGGILFLHERPGVDLSLLHAEADFLLGLVDRQDNDLDLVGDVDDLGRMVDAAGPRHFADVN